MPQTTAEQYSRLTAPYPFLLLTRTGSSLYTTMHLFLLYALTILMYTECLLTLVARPTRQMKVPLDKLSSAGRILSGFNGATMLTMGDIAHPVKVGPVIHQVLFSVVEELGPYNSIIGRAWLHAMKAIPSTYHQTISYLTSTK